MDSRQLRYFAAVYEQGNVSRAADICNVAQSALSHHVANLEAEFGTPLFVRQPRGMEPTAAGERLYEHAKLILKAINAAEKDIRQSGEDVSGDIAIGMAYSATKAIGLSMMKTVIARYPKIKLSLTYPASTGRNFQEILRVIDSLQLTSKHQVATPADWKQGDDVIISGAVNDDDAKAKFGDFTKVKPYLRTTKQPS